MCSARMPRLDWYINVAVLWLPGDNSEATELDGDALCQWWHHLRRPALLTPFTNRNTVALSTYEGRDISRSAFLIPIRRHLNSRARDPLDNNLKFPTFVSHWGWILSLRRDQRGRKRRNKQNLKIGFASGHFCFWQVFTVVVQSLSLVGLSVTPWTSACQASLSFTTTC